MKNRIFLILLLTFVVIGAMFSQNIWKEFTASPTKNQYIKCHKQIVESLSLLQNADTTKTLRQVMSVGDAFLDLVKNGNVYAADLCFQLYPIFDGYIADLEEFTQAIGSFSKYHPKSFITMLGKYSKLYNGKWVGVSIVITTDIEIAEDDEQQKTELQSRLHALNSIRDTSNSILKNECIQMLQKKLHTLEQN